MTDQTRFEDRLARALRNFADQAVVPFEASEIADRAIDTRPSAPRWMPLALVATIGMAAAVAAIVVASEFMTRPVDIADPQLIGAGELPAIVVNASNTPGVWDQTLDERGEVTLNVPMRSGTPVELQGFVDGRATEICATGDSVGCILAWTLLFDTVEEAETAYDFYTAEFEAPNGWNVPFIGRSEPVRLGDESVLYANAVDPATRFSMSGVYLWREQNLVMGAIGVAGMDVNSLRQTADAMQARAAGDRNSAAATRDAAVDVATGHGGLTELLDRHPYDVDAVMPRPDGTVDVFIWFFDEVPMDQWPLGRPPCEDGLVDDPFTGVHARVDLETEIVVAVSPRWGIGTCIAPP